MPSPDYQDRLALLLAQMPHSGLMQLRDSVPPNSPLQAQLAPYEHRAFARELTQENPFMAVPLAIATPSYQLGKLLSPSNLGARTQPSLEELLQAYRGIGEGLTSGR